MGMDFKRWVLLSAFVVVACGTASAQRINDPYRDPAMQAMKGKWVAYLPISLGFGMANAPQGGVTKMTADRYGMKFTKQDPNWNTDAMAQAFTTLIAEKPDIIVTQNPDIQSLARLLKQANAAGIYVIQVNMQGAYQTDAFVGPDFIGIGEEEGRIVSRACGTGSGRRAESRRRCRAS